MFLYYVQFFIEFLVYGVHHFVQLWISSCYYILPHNFKVYGSVHRKYIPIDIQQDTTSHSLFISGNCSTCFGWYLHPSSGVHTTVSTAFGICHTVTAICRYHGSVGVTGTKFTRLTRISLWLQPLSERNFKCNQLYLIAVLCQWSHGTERDNCIRVEVWFSSYDCVCQRTLFVEMN